MPDRPLRIYSDGTQFHTGAGIRTGSILFNRVYNEKGGIVQMTVPPCNYLSLISSIFFSIFLITSRKTASSCPVGSSSPQLMIFFPGILGQATLQPMDT